MNRMLLPTEKRFHFQWDIYNPFLNWQKLEATFYQESPTLTPWKLSLDPLDRGTDFWEFSLFLEYCRVFGRRNEIVAKNVSVSILRGDCSITREVVNFKFCRNNRFKYHVQEKVKMPLQTEPHHLVIKMEIALPDNLTRSQHFGSYSEDEDFACLSKNMKDLIKFERYTNMTLLSAKPEHQYRVHSYVLDARWPELFTEHSRQYFRKQPVNVNISNELLSDLLTYIYSGELRKNWPEWKDSRYAAELCAVIFRYDLHHLYRILVKSDMRQKRVTRNLSLVESRVFPLKIANGYPVKNTSHSWIVNPNSEYEVRFQICVGGEYGNWLSYSLKSRSEFRVSAEVNFIIVKRIEENLTDEFFHVHGATHAIGPKETKDSKPQIFLGCPETFGDSDGTGVIKYFIKCFLNVFDGTKVDIVDCVGEETLQYDSDRFRLLSQHMSELYNRRLYTDMEIHNNVDPEYYWRAVKEDIHKGIFVTRVPAWWKGLVNEGLVEDPNVDMRLVNVPYESKCSLSESSLQSFLEYLYTGYVRSLYPFPNLDEIQKFAKQTMFGSLNDFVNRIAASRINQ